MGHSSDNPFIELVNSEIPNDRLIIRREIAYLKDLAIRVYESGGFSDCSYSAYRCVWARIEKLERRLNELR